MERKALKTNGIAKSIGRMRMKKKERNALVTTFEHDMLPERNTIQFTVYLHPIIYEDSKVMEGVEYDKSLFRDMTERIPIKLINEPLSGPGEELENPITSTWNDFIRECEWYTKENGFTVLSEMRNKDSKIAKHVIEIGLENKQCGSIVCDLKVSDNPLSPDFPEKARDKVMEHLQMDRILDGSAFAMGIDFQVERVVVNGSENDCFLRGIDNLYIQLQRMSSALTGRNLNLKPYWMENYRIHIYPIKGLTEDMLDQYEFPALIICSSRVSRLVKALFADDFCAVSFLDTIDVNDEGAMQPQHADTILSFLYSLDSSTKKVTDLFICCDGGDSRSPAIAAAILRLLGKDDRAVWENPFYTPNILVYYRMCRASGISVSWEEVLKLRQLNEEAYRKAQMNNGQTCHKRWEVLE